MEGFIIHIYIIRRSILNKNQLAAVKHVSVLSPRGKSTELGRRRLPDTDVSICLPSMAVKSMSKCQTVENGFVQHLETPQSST